MHKGGELAPKHENGLHAAVLGGHNLADAARQGPQNVNFGALLQAVGAVARIEGGSQHVVLLKPTLGVAGQIDARHEQYHPQ